MKRAAYLAGPPANGSDDGYASRFDGDPSVVDASSRWNENTTRGVVIYLIEYPIANSTSREDSAKQLREQPLLIGDFEARELPGNEGITYKGRDHCMSYYFQAVFRWVVSR